MTEHFDQRAIRRAAAILKIAAHHSRDELDAALAAARRAILHSLEEAGADIDVRRGPLLRPSTWPSRFRTAAPDFNSDARFAHPRIHTSGILRAWRSNSMMRTSIFLDRHKRRPLPLEPPAPLSRSISHDRASGVDRFDRRATGVGLCAGFLEAVFDCAACHIERGVEFFAGIAAGDFQDDRGAFDRPLVEMACHDCPRNTPSGRGWEARRLGVILRDIIDARMAGRAAPHRSRLECSAIRLYSFRFP